MSPALGLHLPAPEWRRAARLAGPWTDLLYVPGQGFSSGLDPGCYRSTLFVSMVGGELVRVTSLTVPAFGASLCRLRLEPVQSVRLDALGSFFEPARRGLVFAFTADRRAGAVWPPGDPAWCYDGPTLRPALACGGTVRVLRERGRLAGGHTWTADRGLLVGADRGSPALVLAVPDESERVAFLPAPGVHRALVDPTSPERPGADRRELLGYGGWDGSLTLDMEIIAAGSPP